MVTVQSGFEPATIRSLAHELANCSNRAHNFLFQFLGVFIRKATPRPLKGSVGNKRMLKRNPKDYSKSLPVAFDFWHNSCQIISPCINNGHCAWRVGVTEVARVICASEQNDQGRYAEVGVTAGVRAGLLIALR
jgi:hypothetical protein